MPGGRVPAACPLQWGQLDRWSPQGLSLESKGLPQGSDKRICLGHVLSHTCLKSRKGGTLRKRQPLLGNPCPQVRVHRKGMTESQPWLSPWDHPMGRGKERWNSVGRDEGPSVDSMRQPRTWEKQRPGKNAKAGSLACLGSLTTAQDFYCFLWTKLGLRSGLLALVIFRHLDFTSGCTGPGCRY